MNAILINERTLESWNQIFDVDERVFASVLLETLKGFIDQVAEIKIILLTVIDSVVDVNWKVKESMLIGA